MNIAAVASGTLEYLKVILSAPVVAAIVLFLFRGDIRTFLAKVVLARWGKAELWTSQEARTLLAETGQRTQLQSPPTQSEGARTSADERAAAGRTNAALWEYKFLNLFLVPRTQLILDWLAGLPHRLTPQLFDHVLSTWGIGVDERNAIYNALHEHRLVGLEGDLITVTPKGREYIAWRGAWPQPGPSGPPPPAALPAPGAPPEVAPPAPAAPPEGTET